jgi:hypothetical protein
MELLFRTKGTPRRVVNVEELLTRYRSDPGYDYLEVISICPNNKLIPEDLAVTLLVNSNVTGISFKSIRDHGESINLDMLPQKKLEETTEEERKTIAQVIFEMAKWPKFAASVATKVLHKKRPFLIPILDNTAIFGAYMKQAWPDAPSSNSSVKKKSRIIEALNWITADLLFGENVPVWQELQRIEPNRALIQIFDSVWWMYFRQEEPLKRRIGP